MASPVRNNKGVLVPGVTGFILRSRVGSFLQTSCVARSFWMTVLSWWGRGRRQSTQLRLSPHHLRPRLQKAARHSGELAGWSQVPSLSPHSPTVRLCRQRRGARRRRGRGRADVRGVRGAPTPRRLVSGYVGAEPAELSHWKASFPERSWGARPMGCLGRNGPFRQHPAPTRHSPESSQLMQDGSGVRSKCASGSLG